MKKMTLTSIILLSVGLAMVVVGAVFNSVENWGTDFNPDALASVFTNIGYITAALSGIVLVALGVSGAIKNEK